MLECVCTKCQQVRRVRAALVIARRQLVTLGGEARKHPGNDYDMIQAVVLETIDAALAETK